jgi:hypothetical protein
MYLLFPFVMTLASLGTGRTVDPLPFVPSPNLPSPPTQGCKNSKRRIYYNMFHRETKEILPTHRIGEPSDMCVLEKIWKIDEDSSYELIRLVQFCDTQKRQYSHITLKRST